MVPLRRYSGGPAVCRRLIALNVLVRRFAEIQVVAYSLWHVSLERCTNRFPYDRFLILPVQYVVFINGQPLVSMTSYTNTGVLSVISTILVDLVRVLGKRG